MNAPKTQSPRMDGGKQKELKIQMSLRDIFKSLRVLPAPGSELRRYYQKSQRDCSFQLKIDPL